MSASLKLIYGDFPLKKKQGICFGRSVNKVLNRRQVFGLATTKLKQTKIENSNK